MLRNNLQLFGGQVPNAGEAAAHIVASTGSRGAFEAADESRRILRQARVNIDNELNGVFLDSASHGRTHTADFHETVRDRLREAVRGHRAGSSQYRAAVRAELSEIQDEIRQQVRRQGFFDHLD